MKRSRAAEGVTGGSGRRDCREGATAPTVPIAAQGPLTPPGLLMPPGLLAPPGLLVPLGLLMILGLLLSSCSRERSGTVLALDWEPVAEINAGLPRAIRVFASRQDDLPLRAWYVRVRPGPELRIDIVGSADEDGRESVGDFAARLGAVVAVNGGYFRMDLVPARHVGLLYDDGRMIETAFETLRRGEVRYYTARAALGITPAGRPDVAWSVTRNDSLFTIVRPPANRENQPAPRPDFSRARPWPVGDALAAGPALIGDGRIDITVDEEVFFASSIPQTHPRTAAGVTRHGDLVLMVVDGRQAASRGVDLEELAALMHAVGCVEALNLDGGGSSTLVVNGRLVNRPVGGTYQREVMSAVVIVPVSRPGPQPGL